MKDKKHKKRQGQHTAQNKQIMVHNVDMVKPENLQGRKNISTDRKLDNGGGSRGEDVDKGVVSLCT